jgi:hypothetical protein
VAAAVAGLAALLLGTKKALGQPVALAQGLEVIPDGGTVPRALPALLGESYNLKSLGALLDGTPEDKARIQAAYDRLPDHATVEIPGGAWPNGHFLQSDPGKTVGWRLENALKVPGGADYAGFFMVGDGDVTYGYGNGAYQFTRNTVRATSFHPIVGIRSYNDAPEGTGIGTFGLQVTSVATARNKAHSTPFKTMVQSYGTNGYGTFDVASNPRIERHGTNWNWCSVRENYDFTGLGHNGGATQSYVDELDMIVSGSENPAAAYLPTAGDRQMVLLHGQVTAFSPWPGAGRHVARGKVVVASNGYTQICVKDGTTGAAEPGWAASGQTQDGTVAWRVGDVRAGQIAKGFCFLIDEGLAMGTWLTGKGDVYNAPLDLSQVRLTGAKGAGIRLGPDMPLDLSAVGTAESQNARTLGYDSKLGALAYKSAGAARLAVHDGGEIVTAGPMVDAAVQVVSIGGPQEIGAGASKVMVTTGSPVALTMPPAPADLAGARGLEVVFLAPNSTVNWLPGEPAQKFAGAPLPAAVPAGASVRLLWWQDAGTWVHTIPA